MSAPLIRAAASGHAGSRPCLRCSAESGPAGIAQTIPTGCEVRGPADRILSIAAPRLLQLRKSRRALAVQKDACFSLRKRKRISALRVGLIVPTVQGGPSPVRSPGKRRPCAASIPAPSRTPEPGVKGGRSPSRWDAERSEAPLTPAEGCGTSRYGVFGLTQVTSGLRSVAAGRLNDDGHGRSRRMALSHQQSR